LSYNKNASLELVSSFCVDTNNAIAVAQEQSLVNTLYIINSASLLSLLRALVKELASFALAANYLLVTKVFILRWLRL
jgi:hypothetical protein